MLFIVGLFLVILVATGMSIKESKEWSNSSAIDVFIGIFLTGSMLITVLSVVLLIILPYNLIEDAEYNDIISIENQNIIGGGFTLGTGNINSNSVYVFYRNTTDGGLIKSYVDAYSTPVYEDNTVSPRLVEYKFYKYYPWLVWMKSKQKSTYKLYVPENTIIKEFKL